MGEVGCAGPTVSGKRDGDRKRRSRRGTNSAKSRRVSPGGSSRRGSSSPLGGSCYPRRTPSPPVGPAGAAPHPRLPPPGPAQPLPPPCALRPPARPPKLISQTAAAAGPTGGRLRWARRPGARDRRARDPAGERGRAKGAGGAQLQRPAAPRSLRALGGRELPFLLFFLAARPGEASWRARLPPGLARHASPGSTGGTVASPPGPGGPELFLGRYERQ